MIGDPVANRAPLGAVAHGIDLWSEDLGAARTARAPVELDLAGAVVVARAVAQHRTGQAGVAMRELVSRHARGDRGRRAVEDLDTAAADESLELLEQLAGRAHAPVIT